MKSVKTVNYILSVLFPVRIPKGPLNLVLRGEEPVEEHGCILWRAYDVRLDGIERMQMENMEAQ